MIQQINYTKNNRDFVYTYSDKFVYITRNGIEYVDAIDPIEYIIERQYEETDIQLPLETQQDIVENIKLLTEGVSN